MGVYCILNDIRNLKVRLALKTANKIQKSLLYYEDIVWVIVDKRYKYWYIGLNGMGCILAYYLCRYENK